MKSIYKIVLLLLSVLIVINIQAQNNSREVIMKAMKDELNRNINKLKLENLKKPFFISYTLTDIKKLEVKSILGSTVNIDDKPGRNSNVRVMIGSYKLNDENFVDPNNSWGYGGGGTPLPIEDDYYGIRRSFWTSTDNLYKAAAENFERKISARKQQVLTPEEDSLWDYIKMPKVNKILPPKTLIFDKVKWEKIANELSVMFKTVAEIYNSNVFISLYQSDVYFYNSEGSEVVYPMTLASVLINATTQAKDGEPLSDNLAYYNLTPDDLPKTDKIKQDISNMISNLQQLRNAKKYDESYSGPILLENQAAAELFKQRLFTATPGLSANRKPLYNNPNEIYGEKSNKTLEDKLGRKIMSNDITVKDISFTTAYEGTNLIGSYEVDAEGVIPSKELVLVENGILKNLLNGRVPTMKVKSSNGHNRQMVNGSGSMLSPGVISITSNKAINKDAMKKKFVEALKGEGLDYGFIIRKLQTDNAGMRINPDKNLEKGYDNESADNKISQPLYIYKYYLKDGREELVRSTTLPGVSFSALKRTIAVSDKQQVYNDIVGVNSWYSSVTGVPTSFIIPDAIILEELDVDKDKKAMIPKLPIVQSPLSIK